MAFCSNCGAQVAGAFCPNCGTPISSAAGAGTPSASAYAQPPVPAAAGIEAHIAAALCYIPIPPFGVIASLLFIIIAPYNQTKFVRFNAFQSLFLHLALFVISIGLGILAFLAAAIIHVLAVIFIPVWPLLWIGSLVLFLFMMYKSFNNEKVKLPFIGDLAEKQS